MVSNSSALVSPAHLARAIPLLITLFVLAGCSPTLDTTHVAGDVRARAVRAEVADAACVVSASRPYYRWDELLRSRLREEREAPEVEGVRELLRAAADCGEQRVRQEALRLPVEDVPGSDRTALLRRVDADIAEAVEGDCRRVGELDADGLRGFLGELERDIVPGVKEAGRVQRTLLHLPLAPANWAWLGWHVRHEYRGANDVDFAQVRVFTPPPATPATSMLGRHAPTIVQEWPATPDYDPTADLLGAVTVDSASRVAIDTDRPTVYAYETQALLHGRAHRQLVYTWWYPEHPPGSRGDPEAGRIEGVTLRVTLGLDERPRIYETVYNCGCYHRVFADDELEAAARAEYGAPLPGKRSALETTTRRRIDLIVPELFHTLAGAPSGATLFGDELGGTLASSGAGCTVHTFARFHMIGAVRPAGEAELEGRVSASTPYRLAPYEELELVPVGDGYASMFEPNGLVRGAERREGALLSGLGMLSAGQPRQRGTQMIHFDQYDFDDPRLLEQYLRLPHGW